MADGWPADKIFDKSVGLSLDDIVFLPGPPTKATEVDLKVNFTRNVSLKVPIVGGPRAQVEENLAISLALLGGIGIIHRHQSVDSQVAMVRRVKQYEAGFILNPQTLTARHTVADARRVSAEAGCSCIPITDNGRLGSKLLGIVTSRDLEMATESKTQLGSIMTRDLIFVQEPVTLGKAQEAMQTAKVAKLPVVNEDKELVALICRGDLKRSRRHPDATRDPNRQLMVSAAVSPVEDGAWDRAKALLDAGVDVLCVDADDGVGDDTVSFVKRLKAGYTNVDILVGRVSSCSQAKALLDVGIDGLLVGPSRAAATSVYELSKFARTGYGIPMVVDAGVQNGGQFFKVLALSGRGVCVDDLLVRTREAGGDQVFRDGLWIKLNSQPGVPFVGNRAADKGSVHDLVPHLLQKATADLREIGIKSLQEVGPSLTSGAIRLERRLCAEAIEPDPVIIRCMSSELHSRW